VVSDTSGRPANPLSIRPFRRLWLANTTFFLVANAELFMFGWLVLDGLGLGESAQGLVAFTLGLPTALFVLQAGAWADRWDRRRMLVATQLAGASVMAATAALVMAGTMNLGWVVAATLLSGTANALGSPVRSSLVSQLVPREQLIGAIALNAVAMTMSMIIGPVIAKLVGDQFGFEGSFWFLSALLLTGAVLLLRLDVPAHRRVREHRSVVADTRTALRHVRDDPNLTTLFGLLLMASLTVLPAVMVTMQAHVKDELGRSAGAAAWPLALMGFGMALSSLVVIRKGDMRRKGAAFERAMLCGATISILVGLTDDFAVTLVLMFAMGLAGGFFVNMNQGLIQTNTPAELMGRVMGLYSLAAAGLMPLGALLLGMSASVIGTGNTISLTGVVALSILVITYPRHAELRRLS
jgi:MFS family permease